MIAFLLITCLWTTRVSSGVFSTGNASLVSPFKRDASSQLFFNKNMTASESPLDVSTLVTKIARIPPTISITINTNSLNYDGTILHRCLIVNGVLWAFGGIKAARTGEITKPPFRTAIMNLQLVPWRNGSRLWNGGKIQLRCQNDSTNYLWNGTEKPSWIIR